MNIVKTYGNYIKKYAGTHPAVSRKMIDIGLHLEQFRTEHFAEKTMPKAYQKLNTLGVKNTLHALEYPESTVWCNLFAPVEIFQCFGLSALSMECLSSFLSGFTCEDFSIASLGIQQYHHAPNSFRTFGRFSSNFRQFTNSVTFRSL